MQTKDRTDQFSKIATPLLEEIYGKEHTLSILKELDPAIESTVKKLSEANSRVSDTLNCSKWDESSAVLITYADSILGTDTPLQALDKLLSHTERELSVVHLLPFFPFTSDDGFSVSDYTTVNPSVGTWQDIEKLAQSYVLMFDFVINHLSASHEWFQAYQRGELPDFFIEIDPASDDLSQVTRPRSTSLFRPTEVNGELKHVWATFSHDQIDVNFASPAVFTEFSKILLQYLERGATYIRLDAVGFLWKEKGTTCMHLPQTHSLIKVLRALAETVNPASVIITETNVPHSENISYLGKGDEAHMVYNFSLPPMVLHALLSQSSTRLFQWLNAMETFPQGCTSLNILSTHDGIGLRPAEGLIPSDDLQRLLVQLENSGGRISMRTRPDGSLSPYEANITFFDALKGTFDEGEDDLQVDRFIATHAVSFALPGIPAVYILSLLGVHNDYTLMEATGANRSINRSKLELSQVLQQLNIPHSDTSRVFNGILELLRTRRRQSAFSPEAPAKQLLLDDALFCIERWSEETSQRIFAVTNLTKSTIVTTCEFLTPVIYSNLLGSGEYNRSSVLTLAPYESVWLSSGAN